MSHVDQIKTKKERSSNPPFFVARAKGLLKKEVREFIQASSFFQERQSARRISEQREALATARVQEAIHESQRLQDVSKTKTPSILKEIEEALIITFSHLQDESESEHKKLLTDTATAMKAEAHCIETPIKELETRIALTLEEINHRAALKSMLLEETEIQKRTAIIVEANELIENIFQKKMLGALPIEERQERRKIIMEEETILQKTVLGALAIEAKEKVIQSRINLLQSLEIKEQRLLEKNAQFIQTDFDSNDVGMKNAALAANNLIETLPAVRDNFIKGEIDLSEFKSQYKDAITKALPILEKHRGWTPLLLDLLNTSIFIATLSLSYWSTNTFRIFKAAPTNSAQKAYDLQNGLDQIRIL